MSEPTDEPSAPARPVPEPRPRRPPMGAAACEEAEGESGACDWCGAGE